MIHVDGIVSLILLALQIVALAAAGYALFHALRQRKDAFTAVDKLTKPIWLGILAASFLVLLLFQAVFLLGIVAVVAVCVYLVDVRPRVDEVQRGPRW
ncbi:DUF2516 family protein [Rhodococcus triatomae]|uniref:DUF2516 family protein n=1 Tax=Rhodococcus triatomae TaxID=300028 RepID=A0A1G8RPS5_9NOCA|nr:DUF2516 family protein [Rhodococcus triatomae]QNG19894.1 DUF2516 family protein [Rhodococcus triatomae]QNG24191.1 DUF2516 family protein [Rhodococcus triatomae]SDJ18515.1 Protein of unknown function [Rhodococcus triatomae]